MTKGADAMTLEAAYRGKPNSLNAVRLAMAALVIVSHSWWLGGYGPDPSIAGGKLGSWAVVVFFGLSGYLVTLSRLRSPNSLSFFRARFFRIMPGLIVCLLVVAFVFAPMAGAFGGGSYSLLDAWNFVLRNLSLIGTQLGVAPIGSTLADVPDPDHWDSPLWTLFWEVLCYALVGGLSVLKPELFRAAMSILFGLITVFLVFQVLTHGSGAGPWGKIVCPVATFLAGSLLCLFRSRISIGREVVGCAAGVLVLSYFSGTFLAFCPLPLAYLVLWFGASPALHRIGARYDISYGMYIYGWPVQQLLALAGLHNVVPLGVLAVISVLATAPLAWLSCVLVEGPAQRFGRSMESPKRFPALVSG